jgi:hypothetical protein
VTRGAVVCAYAVKIVPDECGWVAWSVVLNSSIGAAGKDVTAMARLIVTVKFTVAFLNAVSAGRSTTLTNNYGRREEGDNS